MSEIQRFQQRKVKVFSTYQDNQTAVDIHVLQGERPMAKDNKRLGNFNLDGIPAAARGVPQIEVTFDIDANGILNVSAKDKGTGKEQKITITDSSGLDKDEVEKLKREAEAHASEDASLKAKVEARNELDNLVYQSEKQVTEMGDKLPADKKSELESAVTEAKQVLENSDAEAEQLNSAKEKISNILQAFAQEMYAQAGAEGGENPEAQASPSPESSASGNAETVDADFEVLDDEDKK